MNAINGLPALARVRRQSYQSYSDYYNDGYNDYNNNRVNQRQRQQFYANGQNNFYTDDRVDQQYAPPVASAPSRIAPPAPVPADSNKKYVYTPLFQYKETEQKHKKLFVPNLFG